MQNSAKFYINFVKILFRKILKSNFVPTLSPPPLIIALSTLSPSYVVDFTFHEIYRHVCVYIYVYTVYIYISCSLLLFM